MLANDNPSAMGHEASHSKAGSDSGMGITQVATRDLYATASPARHTTELRNSDPCAREPNTAQI